ncbi:MAG: plasmid mobilization relaxosome protein MobC [Chloroflexaceae bacterium]|nr:plasmid mobilization relaxosome protein MobC [Chloroflexaceae bacterium]
MERRAKAAGLKLSEYLRRAGLKKNQLRTVPEINRQVYGELGRIGNNLNQLAKAYNFVIAQGWGIAINPEKLSQELAALSEKLDQVRLAVVGLTDEDENSEA